MRLFIFRIFSLMAFAAATAAAQKPTDLFTKAPPDVDEALRGRITKFYQAHVDGKPRRAEELVAEESKDYFYDMKKPKYLSFEITKIDYSDSFTKAKVLVLVGTYLPVMGFADKPVKAPLLSTWKVVDGQWYWYIDPDVINTTPFGKMGTPPGYDPAKSAAGALPDISKGPDLQALSKKVYADKLIARLNPREASSDQVTITNDLPGTVTLQLDTLKVPGFDARLDRTQLKGGEKAVLSLHFQPGKRAPRSMLANVTVQPINALLRIQVLFQ